ncbi:hypothetical protein BHE74_00059522 [Ensete ventricosum]|nr:hypothetical protein BHE74_00059522 [Ensete ventricosum]
MHLVAPPPEATGHIDYKSGTRPGVSTLTGWFAMAEGDQLKRKLKTVWEERVVEEDGLELQQQQQQKRRGRRPRKMTKEDASMEKGEVTDKEDESDTDGSPSRERGAAQEHAKMRRHRRKSFPRRAAI